MLAVTQQGKVRPEALRQLEVAHIPTSGFRSKNWDEFLKHDAPKLDFIFTVCDNAANEVCPVWLGNPMTAHWGVPDPAAVNGTPEQVQQAFRDAFLMLEQRISLFLRLPHDSEDRPSLKKEIENIGRQ